MMATGTPSGPTRSLRERQREERERLILQAAEELLLEQGYHETSMDEIAARVGVSKGTVYLHFASKEELVLALTVRDLQEAQETLDEIIAAPGAAHERLGRFFLIVYGGMTGARFKAITALMQNPEMIPRLAEMKERLHARWEELAQRVGVLLEEGKASGEFDPAMPTRLMLHAFFGQLNPRTYEYLVVREGMRPDELIEQLQRFYFKGIAASAPQDKQDIHETQENAE